VQSVGEYIRANLCDIRDAFKRGGPIVFEVFLGVILCAFGIALALSSFDTIANVGGYTGFRFLSSSDDVWGWALIIVGIMKCIPRKPLWWRIISTFLLFIIFALWVVNFYIFSPQGAFYWIFVPLSVESFIAFCMLVSMMYKRHNESK
jgi:Mn2+/Fe2+ NRAMP family transporter